MAALDFTRQERSRLDLEHSSSKWATKPSNHMLQEWTGHVKTLETPVWYACACPLTDAELAAYAELGQFGQNRPGADGSRLAYRFFKSFVSWDKQKPLRDVPEIELALQAMLACSLKEAYGVPSAELHALQKLVESYWSDVMSVFSTCVQEIKLSTCPEIEAYREWFAHMDNRQSIFLIPIGDVNHTRARFYAYPQVWEVFATVFGEEYRECLSFYCTYPNAPPDTAFTTLARQAAAAAETRAALPSSSALDARVRDVPSDDEEWML